MSTSRTSLDWSHTPPPPRLPVIIWSLWAFPFTIWDTVYLALRPHSLPGGKWHNPYFSGTFTLWASIDTMNGDAGWRNKSGFVLAQSVINMVEVTLYMVYILIVSRKPLRNILAPISGCTASWAVLVGFGAGCVTLTKTSLYFMREAFSGWKYTGHNEWPPFLIMNLLFVMASSYMVMTFGKDILEGLNQNPKKAQ